MQLLHSPESWVYRFGFTQVDFCLWVLEVDGLQVPPFDRHSAGDGNLQTIGLDQRGWQSWLVQVVTLQEAQQRAWQQLAHRVAHRVAPPSPEEWRATLIPEAHDPARAWQGDVRVGQRLAELWKQYGPLAEGREEAAPHLSRLMEREDRDSGQRLYDLLQRYRSRIPTLAVHLATYPAAINYLIPPVAVVMTIPPAAARDASALRERILDAAAGLGTLAKGTGRAPRYAPAASGTPGQPTPVYRMFASSPAPAAIAPPSPPRREVAADDDVQQAALDELSMWSRTGEMVDLSTVRFLRAKSIPSWQLLDVTYDDDEGAQQRRTMIFRRDERGGWRTVSAATSSDLQTLVTEWLVPIRDHPLIFVSGSKGGHADGSRQFVAHGELLDNGFEVVRVRLSNDAGQTFEDVVNDGLVLFAALQHEEVQWPMQAELYDQAGRLVWRETVLDNRPPGWMPLRR
jgi:hypothetical protein